tara:strand:+ start:229 stop:351 length:123 start_codon:yes stop_codon:yes gene_type:complete
MEKDPPDFISLTYILIDSHRNKQFSYPCAYTEKFYFGNLL